MSYDYEKETIEQLRTLLSGKTMELSVTRECNQIMRELIDLFYDQLSPYSKKLFDERRNDLVAATGAEFEKQVKDKLNAPT